MTDCLVSAVVLAGGQSSRMGQDKALLQVNGQPLLQQICQVALQVTPVVSVITSQPQKYQAIAPAPCRLLQEHLAPSDRSPQGPLVGFRQALETVQTTWVLLLACDLPYLQVGVLQRWMRQLTDANEAIALLPQTARGWEPLCGFYHIQCLDTLVPFVEQGGRSFQRWLAEIPVRAIEFSTDSATFRQENRMLFNCNTPDDLTILHNHPLHDVNEALDD